MTAIIDLGMTFDPASVASDYIAADNPRIAFVDLMREHGFQVNDTLNTDWKVIRVKDSHDVAKGGRSNGKKSGWYLYSEMLEEKTGGVIGIGVFGSFHGSPEKVVWTSKKVTALTPTEQRTYLARLEQAKADRERELAELQKSAVNDVNQAWQDADVFPENHGYCKRKNIAPLPKEARCVSVDAEQYPNWLIIKIGQHTGHNGDKDAEFVTTSAQYISDRGDKYFHSGGKIKGCYAVLEPKKRQSDSLIYIVEGFATGQSVRDVTDCLTYVAFNAGNLGEVAAFVRARHQDSVIILAGDNDHQSRVGNTGKAAAEAAAVICGGFAKIPPSIDGIKDWNDYLNEDGPVKMADLLRYTPEAKAERGKFDTATAGLIDLTVNWINVNSFFQHPELALINVIAALGAVCGRRYKLEDMGTRTNIYTLGIAPTGSGKDNSRQRVKELLRAAGLGDFIGSDEIRSGAGLLDHVAMKPAMLYQIDEFGMFLKAMGNANNPGYSQTIPAILTKLYSSSASSYETGNLKGEEGLPPTIVEPCLSIYGTTTETVYAEAMKASAISSGELNRYIVVRTGVDFPEPNATMKRTPPPDMLLRHWNALKPLHGKDIIEVGLGEQRDGVYALRMYQREMQITLKREGLDGVFARYVENTLKVAMILAIARNPEQPMLEADILAYSANMVENSLRYILDFARDRMFETPEQKQRQDVIELIRSNGGQMQRTLVMRHFRLTAHQMSVIEDSLSVDVGSGILVFDKSKKPIVYRLVR